MSLFAISELQVTTLCMTYRQIKVPEAKLVTDRDKNIFGKKVTVIQIQTF